jgi:hypothetical protein
MQYLKSAISYNVSGIHEPSPTLIALIFVGAGLSAESASSEMPLPDRGALAPMRECDVIGCQCLP